MKEEIIIRLLSSSNTEDVLLALNYMGDYTIEKILSFSISKIYRHGAEIHNECFKQLNENYKLNDKLYCNLNNWLFFTEFPFDTTFYQEL